MQAHVMLLADPNYISRCAAKMVLNFVALHFGSEFALDPRLDGVRDYIRTHVPVVPVKDPETGEDGIAMDLRYVNHWVVEIEEQILPTDTHAIDLRYRPQLGLLARVIVFGTPYFKVWLGAPGLSPPPGPELPAVLVVQDKHETLVTGEDVRYFFEFNAADVPTPASVPR